MKFEENQTFLDALEKRSSYEPRSEVRIPPPLCTTPNVSEDRCHTITKSSRHQQSETINGYLKVGTSLQRIFLRHKASTEIQKTQKRKNRRIEAQVLKCINRMSKETLKNRKGTKQTQNGNKIHRHKKVNNIILFTKRRST